MWNLPKLAVVLIEFASEVAAAVMVVDYRVEHRSIVTIIRQLDQPILGPMVTKLIDRWMNLNAYLNDVAEDRLTHDLNVAYDELHHVELLMAHRIYSVKENLSILFEWMVKKEGKVQCIW